MARQVVDVPEPHSREVRQLPGGSFYRLEKGRGSAAWQEGRGQSEADDYLQLVAVEPFRRLFLNSPPLGWISQKSARSSFFSG